MNSQKLWNISTQQVSIFLKAVELKNFTQTANYFNFTPSMISKTIASLEAELELFLFIRKPHELTPTPAALLLAKEWRQFIGAFNNSVNKARSCQMRQRQKLVLGFVDSSGKVDDIISAVILDYMRSCPQIDIIAEKHDMHRLSELLNHGMLDIILTSAMEVPWLNAHGLRWEKLFDSGAAVFVPEANSLFSRESLDFSDLKAQKIIALDPVMHPTYNSWLSALCRERGFSPDIVQTYRTVRSLLFGLKMHDYIFIGDAVTSDWCGERLKCFTLPEKSFSLLAWREGAEKELLNFKEFLTKQYSKKA